MISLISYQGVNYVYEDFETEVALLEVENSKENYIKKDKKIKKSIKTLQKSEYSSISNRNLFNIAVKAEVEDENYDLSNIKKSQRSLKLWGTITGLGDRNIAIIEDSANKKQDLYRIDDVISGAKITRIVRNKVVLNINGVEEILEVSDQVEPTYSRNVSSKPKKKVKKSVINVKRSLVENAFENLNKLSKEIKVRPYYKNGEPQGIRIRRIARLSFFRKIGLRSGDVLKSVQGVQIKSIRDAMNIQSSLRGAGTVNVEIERMGMPLNIEYKIDNR